MGFVGARVEATPQESFELHTRWVKDVDMLR